MNNRNDIDSNNNDKGKNNNTKVDMNCDAQF